MRLKIVTYNIKSGLYHPEGLEAVAKVLEEAEPQVVALQEVDRDTRRARHEDQTAWLSKRLGMPYHCFGAATPWDGGGEYGVALLSTLPLRDQQVTHLWVPQGKDVPHGAREPRVVLSAAIDGVGLRVLVTHLGLDSEQRYRQAEQLLEHLSGEVKQFRNASGGSGSGDSAGAGAVGNRSTAVSGSTSSERPARFTPAVLTGDLNGTPSSPEVKLLSDHLCDVLGNLPESERITFPSGDPEMHGTDFLARTIDYIFVTEGVKVESAAVIADYSLASDHNPCEAVIEVS